MHIKFNTDDSINGKGFHAHYLLVPYGAVAHQNSLSLSPLVVNGQANSPPSSHYRSEQPTHRNSNQHHNNQQQHQQPQRSSPPAPPSSPSRTRVPFHGSRYISALHRTSPWVSQKFLHGNYRPVEPWRVPYRSPPPPPQPPSPPRQASRMQPRIYSPHGTWKAAPSTAGDYRRWHPQLKKDVEYGIHEVGSVTSSYLPAAATTPRKSGEPHNNL